jgi:hypothetical protein
MDATITRQRVMVAYEVEGIAGKGGDVVHQRWLKSCHAGNASGISPFVSENGIVSGIDLLSIEDCGPLAEWEASETRELMGWAAENDPDEQEDWRQPTTDEPDAGLTVATGIRPGSISTPARSKVEIIF